MHQPEYIVFSMPIVVAILLRVAAFYATERRADL